jgi:hypothetical protein
VLPSWWSSIIWQSEYLFLLLLNSKFLCHIYKDTTESYFEASNISLIFYSSHKTRCHKRYLSLRICSLILNVFMLPSGELPRRAYYSWLNHLRNIKWRIWDKLHFHNRRYFVSLTHPILLITWQTTNIGTFQVAVITSAFERL